ncbi:MAG TPA: tetratricopeptide repeat protein [Thermoanaerobaculia bacterium]|nr:tetratricopeptide repeat protein [Thermoanaerobaculia bacterium]
MSSLPPTTPRIEDLRARLRLDPKARHFYPLAEELRKLGQLDEAEKILRDGLVHHGTYLSAWVSLGRVQAEKGAHREAVDALLKALALDPGNVVCARLLSASYLALGDKVEALKKMKLVRAVMPGDDELDEQIAKLEAEIAEPARPAGFAPAASEPQAAASVPAPPATEAAAQEPPAPEAPVIEPEAALAAPEASGLTSEPQPVAPPAEEPAPQFTEEPSGARETAAPAAEESSFEPPPPPSPFITEPEEERAPPPSQSLEAADVLPEEVFAPGFEAESPAAAAVPESQPAAPAVEEPSIASSLSEESFAEPAPRDGSFEQTSAEPRADVAGEPFPAEEPLLSAEPMRETWPSEAEEPQTEPAAIADDQTATLTMAELYAKQGHDDAAREIYERVLERDPGNEDVRARLTALSSSPAARPSSPRNETAARLERWLEKVARREL